jgi:hypothetical protein
VRPGGVENWRKIPIAGLPDRYEVSNLGRVRTLDFIDARGHKQRGRIMAQWDAQIWLMQDGRNRWFAVASLVLHAFIGPPPAGKYLARHLDDDRSHNQLSNLAWGDDMDNHLDAVRNGADFNGHKHKVRA